MLSPTSKLKWGVRQFIAYTVLWSVKGLGSMDIGQRASRNEEKMVLANRESGRETERLGWDGGPERERELPFLVANQRAGLR
jgi:hypothetical protein